MALVVFSHFGLNEKKTSNGHLYMTFFFMSSKVKNVDRTYDLTIMSTDSRINCSALMPPIVGSDKLCLETSTLLSTEPLGKRNELAYAHVFTQFQTLYILGSFSFS